jgi:hypothetical protein
VVSEMVDERPQKQSRLFRVGVDPQVGGHEGADQPAPSR